MEQPSARASFISKVFFCWAIPLLYNQYRSKTSQKFEYLPLNQHKSNLIGAKLEQNWLKQRRNNSKTPKLWKALWETFHKPLISLALIFFISEFAFKITQPWFIGKLMEQYSKATKTNKNNVYLYGSLLLIANLLNTLINHFYLFQIQHLGMKIRVACCSLIYRKLLRLHPVALLEMGSGKMINLVSNDVNRFDMAPMLFFQLVIAPIETVIIIYCLYVTCGLSTIPGIVFLILFVPFQLFLGKLASRFRMKTATKTDQRISILNEIISGIKLIKMCGWENLFADKVNTARKIEIKQIKLASYLRALNSSFMIFMNRTGIFLCIATYALSEDKKLDAKYVFVVSGFFAILRQALTVYFPNGIHNFFETKVSISRIEHFLLLPEISQCNNEVQLIEEDEEKQQMLKNSEEVNENCRILLDSVSIEWPNFTMNNLNFELNFNEFAVLTGSVGSGKSSVLLSILKQTTIPKGRVSLNGTISYSPQEPWLFSDTIKNNILFKSQLNQNKYETILNVCGLVEDLKSFPDGDETQVGENGALLSGGQKARVNLARAIYKEADIYLLDDPMSSVDLNVARHIFKKCILEYLKNKSVVLITSDQQFINNSFVNKVYEIKSNNSLVLLQTSKNVDDINLEQEISIRTEEKRNITIINDSNNVALYQKKNNRLPKKVYKEYQKSGSGNNQLITLITLFVAFLSTQILASGVDYFPAYWANLLYENVNKELVFIYMGMIIGCIVVTTSRSIIFFKFCNKASYVLHKKMFSKLIMADLTFFNANSSSGQILNRFTKDMGFVDEYLPALIMDTLQIAFIIAGSILLVIYLSNWIILPTILIMALFYFLRILFLKTSRVLKQNETKSKSPIFSYIRESVQGLPTIRSFNVETSQITQFDRLQDIHSSAFYIYLSCNRAFGFWIDLLCVFYTIIVFITIAGLYNNAGKAGNVGLAITQTINLIGLVQWGLRQWTELENQMVSVERIVEYSQIKIEEDCYDDNSKEKWNETITNNNGRQIVFKSVSFKFTTNNYILKDLSFMIKPNEKIGIVGRTGAGKTCLISMLLRLFQFEGSIFIDNIDIKKIPLKYLRRNLISVIPQEPILFTGSLRDNLDPLNQFKDEQIWKVLDEVQMKDSILGLPEGLCFKISENGANFSIGQRQLLCLARAFLKKSKILILDEATANVDKKTSNLIHEIVMSKSACTVLSVAHRLQSILNADRVLVLADFQVKEFDNPRKLIQNQNSVFSKLLNEDQHE